VATAAAAESVLPYPQRKAKSRRLKGSGRVLPELIPDDREDRQALSPRRNARPAIVESANPLLSSTTRRRASTTCSALSWSWLMEFDPRVLETFWSRLISTVEQQVALIRTSFTLSVAG
jgi:hypothetical protein